MGLKIQMTKGAVLVAIALVCGSVASAKATLVGINDVRGGSLLFASKTPDATYRRRCWQPMLIFR